MIYLILKIFVYLVFALLLGGGAGWLLRHFVATQREEQLQRDLSDARTKVPQLESMIRARDEKIRQLTKVRDELPGEDTGSRVQDEQLTRQLREQEMEIQRLKGKLAEAQTAAEHGLIAGDALIPNAADDLDHSGDSGSAIEERVSDELLASLHKQIEQQKEELAAARIQLELAGAQQDYQREAEELSQRLRQRAADQERMQQAIEREKTRVLELERERELQAKSLRVLHQQLELAREGSASAGRSS